MYKATLSVNGVNKSYINSPTLGGVSWRFIDTGFVAGTNTVRFSGQTFDQSWVNSYGCTFAALNMNVDLTWDVPPPGSEPTPYPSIGSPSPDPSATPSGSGSGDPNGSPSPGGSGDPNATPSPGTSPSASPDPNPSASPSGPAPSDSPSPSPSPSDSSGGTGGNGGTGGSGGSGGTGGDPGSGGSGGSGSGATPSPMATPSPEPSSTETPTPPEPTTTSEPSPSPTPAPDGFTADKAFTPNGNGVADTNRIEIQTQGPWTLTIESWGVIATGTGSQTVTWDGRVGGFALYDGAYKLILQTANKQYEAEIFVDGQQPRKANKGASSFRLQSKSGEDLAPEIREYVAEGARVAGRAAAFSFPNVTLAARFAVVLRDARVVRPGGKTSDIVFEKSGSFNDAELDFDFLADGFPRGIVANGIKYAYLPDGATISLRDFSSEKSGNMPTITYTPSKANRYAFPAVKIRYNPGAV